MSKVGQHAEQREKATSWSTALPLSYIWEEGEGNSIYYIIIHILDIGKFFPLSIMLEWLQVLFIHTELQLLTSTHAHNTQL